jgi:hypothetical protein
MNAQNVAPISHESILASRAANVRREERREVVTILREVMNYLTAARQRDDAIGRALQRVGHEVGERLAGILDDTREAERHDGLAALDGVEFLGRVTSGLAAARESFVPVAQDRSHPGRRNAVAQANALHHVLAELRRIGPGRIEAVRAECLAELTELRGGRPA